MVVEDRACQGLAQHDRVRIVGRREPTALTHLDAERVEERRGNEVAAQHAHAHGRGAVNQGLHVGRVINEYQDSFSRGDFLIRNVVGADPNTGSLAVGDYVRAGQTVQFHLRDAQSADEDLRELLAATGGPASGGGLLFTCNGRGTRLFDEPHHDAGLVHALLGQLPLAGFFAQGELGPIGGRNFIHGFTASLVLFEGG